MVHYPLVEGQSNCGCERFVRNNEQWRVKSPWHRAVAQFDGDRFSVASFYNPLPQTQIKPIENAPNKSDNYKKMIVGEYLQHYYRNAPHNEKRAILYAKD